MADNICPSCGNSLNKSFKFCPYCQSKNPYYNPNEVLSNRLEAKKAKLMTDRLTKEAEALESQVFYEYLKNDAGYLKLKQEGNEFENKKKKKGLFLLISGIIFAIATTIFLMPALLLQDGYFAEIIANDPDHTFSEPYQLRLVFILIVAILMVIYLVILIITLNVGKKAYQDYRIRMDIYYKQKREEFDRRF